MKPKNSLRTFLAFAGSSLMVISSASAQLYWDGNDGTAGFGTATGTWAAPTVGTTTSGWSTSGTGLTAIDGNSVTTATTDSINFGNGATGLGAGTITVSGTVDSGSMTFASGSGAIVLSGGTINLAATTSITVNNTTNTISSNITGAGTSLTKAGSGTLVLSGTRSGSGLTIITGGTLIARPGSLGSGGITFTTANTTLHFQTDSNLTSNNAIGADSASANRTFVVDRITSGAAVDVSVTGSGTGSAVAFARNNVISFTKGANITSGTPTFTFRNGIRNQDSTSVTLASNPTTFSPTDVNVVINGITSSASRTRAYIFQGNSHGNQLTGTFDNSNGTAVRKAGTGTWTFNGTSNYSLQTEINAGTLKFGKQTALYNNNTANWTAANLRVQNGATLAFNVGGTGEFTTGNVTTLLTNLADSSSSTNGMNAGSFFGFDTTNAAGGSFTIADAIANTTGTSGGARGLTKLGTGTLVLSSASNSYTGATTISQGTLQLGASNVLPDSSLITVGGAAANGILDLNGNSDTTTVLLGLGNNSSTTGGLTHSIVDTGTTKGVLTIGNSSGTSVIYRPGAAGFNNGQATISANLGLADGVTVLFDVVDSNNAALEVLVSGTISGTTGSLSKGNTGIMRLTGPNTYQGRTFINNGTLEVNTLADIGTASSLGTGDQVAGTSDIIRIGTGTNANVTLNYIGNGSSSNRRIQVGEGAAGTATSGATLLNTGSGALVFSSATSTTPFNVADTAATVARTLTLGGSNTDANTIQGAIVNNGITLAPAVVNVVKQDAGTWILSGTNTYTGTTTVSAGVLAVNGSLANTSTTVTGGTLQGSGSIGGSVTVQNGGTLSPGNSIESLGTGALSFESGSTYKYEFQTNLYGTTPGVSGDLTFSTGTLDIVPGAILTLTDLAASTALVAGSKFTLISYFGGWTSTELFTYAGNTLNNAAEFTIGSNTWRFLYNDISGGSNFATDQAGASGFVTMTVIPEPKAAFLGSIGMLLLLRRRR